jgi:hypothetical protein
MKTSKYGNCSSFWIKQKLTTIRNRCTYSLNTKDNNVQEANYLWSQCFNKARNKLYYRFNNWIGDNRESDDVWIPIIASFKSRLKHRFDDEYAWRYTEYTIVEKMNKQEFYRIESPSLLWHHVAVDKAGKANHLWTRKSRIKKRTKKYSWVNVINISKTRIKNYELLTSIKDQGSWNHCFKVNNEKFRMRCRWLFSWEMCIYRSYKKIIRQ